MADVLLWTLATLLAYMFLVWLLSLSAGRVCVIDAFWGPGFGLLAGATVMLRPALGLSLEQKLLLAMVLIWGLRLGMHLSIRIASD
ncbi:MAG: DUF1295 domain-containing protein, partial [Planctomycetia bacterium]